VFFRTFWFSFFIALVGLIAGFVYGGTTGLALTAILAVLEVSLSFDNAVVNATVLVRMSPFWQKIFLTIGVAIAVFGMRLIFPLLIVGITANLGPVEAINLALEKGDPDEPGTYGYLLHEAHPAIAAFGGMFLLMLFLDFVFEEREITWLTWLEKPLAKIGRLDQLSVVVALSALAVSSYTVGKHVSPDDAAATHERISTVMVAGVLGIVTYLLVNGLGELFEAGADDEDDEIEIEHTGPATGDHAHSHAHEHHPTTPEEFQHKLERGAAMHVVGKAAFFLFL
jgi:hypothetical protein